MSKSIWYQRTFKRPTVCRFLSLHACLRACVVLRLWVVPAVDLLIEYRGRFVLAMGMLDSKELSAPSIVLFVMYLPWSSLVVPVDVLLGLLAWLLSWP